MRERRRCALTGREAVVSTERLGRPVRFRAATFAPVDPSACPFCPGNEAHTTSALDEIVDSSGWRCRAFPNRWPALVVEASERAWQDGPNAAAEGLGAHEVIVESPGHDREVWRRPGDLAASLGLAWRRSRDLERDRRLRQVQWFRNQGPLAGGSQPHPHSQIVALPEPSAFLLGMLDRCARHHRATGRALLDDLAAHERGGPRWIARTGDVDVWAAYAPQFGWETWIVPVGAGARLSAASADQVADVGATLERVLAALDEVLPGFDANVVLHGAPVGASDSGFRWFLRVCPRRVAWGGFEVATDASMLSVSPEHAADTVRGAWVV